MQDPELQTEQQPELEAPTTNAQFEENGNEEQAAAAEDEPQTAVPAEEEPQAPAPAPIDPMLLMRDIHLKPNVQIPEDIEVTKAKSYLKSAAPGKVSMYDHLASVVMRVLETRPSNALDKFEQISSNVKRERFEVPSKKTFKDARVTAKQLEYAHQIISLSEHVQKLDPTDAGDVPDILELNRLWEWAGVSLGIEDTYHLFLELRKLVKEERLKSVRVWGKILGTKKNYFVIEADNGEDPIEEERQAPKKDEEEEDDGLPKPKPISVPQLTPEINAGVNRYTYYVTNQIGTEWKKLPHAHPQKLQTARQVHKFFTGDLNNQIISYPPFNDNEAMYLRCQIARIAASTVIAPVNYYIPDPEAAEDGDEGNGPKKIVINPEYESTGNDSFLSPENWVHHTPHILPQGRTVWQNPFPKAESGDGDEQEEEAKDEEPVEPESGKEILTMIAADDDHEKVPAWHIATAAKFLTKHSPVYVRSNRWPGATSIIYNNMFTNVYVGYGLKDLGAEQAIVLPALPTIQKEWSQEDENGELIELKEQVDPSVDQEEAYEDELQMKKDLAEENDEKAEDE